MQEHAAEFQSVLLLVQALHCLVPRPRLFPERVNETGPGRWAVPLRQLDAGVSAEDLGRLSRQHGWGATVVSIDAAGSPQIRLAALIVAVLHRVDPLRATAAAPPPGVAPYLVAAANERQAQRLLWFLTRSLAQGIGARPLAIEVGAPAAFLWAITRGEPPLTLFRLAAGVWWRPVKVSANLWVYRPWPYLSRLGGERAEGEILARVPWGIEAGFVLQRPQQEPVVVRVGAGEPLLGELVEVAEFAAAPAPPAEVDGTVGASALHFTVDLRLVPAPPRSHQARRITELGHEIEAKKRLLERLQDTGDGRRQPEASPETLLLFYERRGAVPFPIRRLVVEWTDQNAELGSLQYLKLKPERLPANLVPWGQEVEVHLLTTARALGKQGTDLPGLDLVLRDYAPSRGAAFDLLPAWARPPLDLRLFVLRNHHLALYPQVRPTPLAAGKLARCLLPGGEMNGSCALLMPSEDGLRVQAIQLRREAFRPFIHAFEWDCAANVEPTVAEIARVQAGLSDRFVSTIEEALGEATVAEARDRLGRRRDDLAQGLQTLAKELQARTQQIEKLETALAAEKQHHAAVHAVLAAEEQDRRALVGRLRAVVGDLAGELRTLQEIQRAAQGLLGLTAEQQALRKRLAELQDSIQSLSRH